MADGFTSQSHRFRGYAKTRPVAIFRDDDALMSAPLALTRANARVVLWCCWMLQGAVATNNPLAEGDARQALLLARRAWANLINGDSAWARGTACASAFLHNRYEDDGGNVFEGHWINIRRLT